MYKLITSAKNSHYLSIGFDRDRNTGRDQLTRNKNTKGKYHVRSMLQEVFGFADYQEKATSGLG